MTGAHLGKLRMAWPPLCNPVVGPVAGIGTLVGAVERAEYQMVRALTLQKVVARSIPRSACSQHREQKPDLATMTSCA